MINFEIGNKTYELPQGWDELPLSRFEKLVHHSSILSDYKSQILYAIEMFGILLDAPPEDIKRLDRASYEILAEHCNWANKPVETTNRKEWVIDGVGYKAFDNLNDLSMGDSISLELLINDSIDSELLTNILPVLIRKSKEVVRNGKTIKVVEEFDSDNYEETKELFRKHLTVADTIWIRDFFLITDKGYSTTTRDILENK